MTILNLEGDGNHTILICIIKYFVQKKNNPLTRDTLVEVLCKNFANDQKDRTNKTLTRWTDLQLFVNDAGKISIAHKYWEVLSKYSESNKTIIPEVIRNVIFSDVANNDKNGTLDFNFAMSYFLLKKINFEELTDYSSVYNLMKNDFEKESEYPIGNDTRWSGLKKWARFLGFGYSINKEFIPDPTEAIYSLLPLIFKESDFLNQGVFLERLAELVPILDSGTIRKELERKLLKLETENDIQISSSLSFALVRLHERKIIELHDDPDTDFKKINIFFHKNPVCNIEYRRER